MSDEVIETLSRTECDDLLRQGRYGRVIYTDHALPGCTPVNYAVDGHSLVFLTAGGSRLAVATDHQVVAFEVDEIDPATHAGWSVVATGNATPITAVTDLARVEQLGLSTWAPGERQHWVCLSPGIVTGRRLRAMESAPAAATAIEQGPLLSNGRY
jgi:nitroimidazol reductase NimA-like FMN-containing flavoprotein (pyridoxamine 5'-phosphate oxidase superfamily)